MGRFDSGALPFMAGTDLLVLVFALWWGRRPLHTWLPRWPEFRGVTVAPEDCRDVASQLVRGRKTRTIGAAAGLPLSQLVAAFGPASRSLAGPITANPLVWAAICYGLACGFAERQRSSLQPGPGTALFADRSLTTYLPPRALAVQRLLAAAAVGVVVASAGGRVVGQLGLLAAGGGIYAIAESGQRWIGRRRQGCVTFDQVAVDDAVRSSAVHAIAAAISAVTMFVIGVTLLAFAGGPMSLRHAAMLLAALGVLTCAYPTFRAFSDPQTRWHPRRVAGVR